MCLQQVVQAYEDLRVTVSRLTARQARCGLTHCIADRWTWASCMGCQPGPGRCWKSRKPSFPTVIRDKWAREAEPTWSHRLAKPACARGQLSWPSCAALAQDPSPTGLKRCRTFACEYVSELHNSLHISYFNIIPMRSCLLPQPQQLTTKPSLVYWCCTVCTAFFCTSYSTLYTELHCIYFAWIYVTNG